MSNETSIVGSIASRYANALYDLSRDAAGNAGLRAGFGFDGKTDPTLTVEADMRALETAIGASRDLRSVISSPIFSREVQARTIDALAARMGLSGLTRRFLGLLAANRRLFALPRIITAFKARLAEARGEASAEVTSARALSANQVSLLRTRLCNLLGKDVRLTEKVDPALLGGLVVKVGSVMIDSSLKTKLDTLQLALKGA